jgi:hypothetical protein
MKDYSCLRYEQQTRIRNCSGLRLPPDFNLPKKGSGHRKTPQIAAAIL